MASGLVEAVNPAATGGSAATEVEFFVPGLPRPGGSKRAFINPKTKRPIVTEDNSRSKDWRASVAQIAAMTVPAPLDGPLEIAFDFFLPRPKGHFGSGRNGGRLKPGAPTWHAVRPDCTKLIRSTEDALSGICWRDDSQIAKQTASKRYADRIGVLVRVAQL